MDVTESVKASNIPDHHKTTVLAAIKFLDSQRAPSRVLVGLMMDLQRKHHPGVKLPVSRESLDAVLSRTISETPILDIKSRDDGGAEVTLTWKPK